MERSVAVYGHTEKTVGFSAVNFGVHKVAPTPDALSDKKTESSQIKKGKRIYFLATAIYKPVEKSDNNSPVDSKSAVADIEDFPKAFII